MLGRAGALGGVGPCRVSSLSEHQGKHEDLKHFQRAGRGSHLKDKTWVAEGQPRSKQCGLILGRLP